MVMAADTTSASRSAIYHLSGSRTHEFTSTRCGFTFLEMIIVLLLMATTAVIAVPRWSASLQKLRVSNAASRIVTDLARTQSAAYNSSASKTVTFTVGSSQYTVSALKPLTNSPGQYVVALSADPFQCRLVSVWGQTGTQTIIFNGYGVPNKGGNIIIAAGSYQKTVVVDATSGTAVVQ